MRKWCAGVAVLMTLVMAGVRVYAQPDVGAQGAVLIEQSTGRVLWSQNGEEELPMASTTKIMTALCVLQNATLADTVRITGDMVGIEGSSIYLEAGEELTVEELLYGLMLRSGNDAAVALAKHTAGSVAGFADIMNRTAVDLGLTQSHFVNPHGLPAKDHYTTAIELGRITCKAMEYAAFTEIVKSRRKVIPWKGRDYGRAMGNKNKILSLYEGGNGVKTGYTKVAGRCLVSSAEREDMQLVAVALNCPDMWNDSMEMLDYGFEAFSMRDVLSSEEAVGTVEVSYTDVPLEVMPARDVQVPLMEDEEAWVELEMLQILTDSVAQGDVLGYATIGVENQKLMVVSLVAARSMEKPTSQLLDAVGKIFLHWFSNPKV